MPLGLRNNGFLTELSVLTYNAGVPDWSSEDRYFMELALKLASLGVGFTTPNPCVGAVLVNNGRVVGIGYHKKKGMPHAEVLAIEDAKGHTDGATMYVTLEPHQFYGAVPPCTDAIIDARIKRVVVSTYDPNPKVKGQGIEILRKAGIQVDVGLFEGEARRLNAPYFKVMEKGKAFVTLKLALTLDGFIADKERNSKWISSEPALKEVHKLRGEVDGVLVGVGTVLIDNPILTPRYVHPARIPSKIIYDPSLDTPPSASLFTDCPKCILLTTERSDKAKREKLRERGADIWILGNEKVDVNLFLTKAAQEGLYHILLEGGAGVSSLFLEANAVDRMMMIYAPRVIGEGLSPFSKLSPRLLKNSKEYKIISSRITGEDSILILEPSFTKEED